MRLLAIDPGSKPGKRAWSEWELGPKGGLLKDYGAGRPVYGGHYDWVACESQWPNPDASRQSLITLAQHAGFLLGLARAARYFFVPPLVWKDRLRPGCGNAKKAHYTAALRQMWPSINPKPRPGEKQDPAADILDAIGLGASFFIRGGYSAADLEEMEIS